MNGVTNMGWSKIAWTYGLRALKQLVEKPIDYDRDIFSAYVKDVLRRGGDTDTNASILGGMLGAITGFKRLPEKYITTMMELRFPPEKK
jgi:ADP-ribosylglycohydrolase